MRTPNEAVYGGGLSALGAALYSLGVRKATSSSEASASFSETPPPHSEAQPVEHFFVSPYSIASETKMSFFHAVLLIDHHTAKVLQFDAQQVEIERVFEKKLYTRQHNSHIRTEHAFYAEVCDALAGIAEILIVGAHQAQADFRRYVETSHASLLKRIIGWETVDHPTEPQLVAFARKYFAEHEREAASPPHA